MKCKGRNLDQHCCWIGDKPCLFLEENTELGFRWSCGLRRELGSWDAVLEDLRYKELVQPIWDELPQSEPTTCKDFPSGTWECRQCYPVKHGG
jgi:hypothetical protein